MAFTTRQCFYLSVFLGVVLGIASHLNSSTKSLKAVQEVYYEHPEIARGLSSYSVESLKVAGIELSGPTLLTEHHPSNGGSIGLASDGDAPKERSNNKKTKPLNVIVLYPDDWRHDSIGGVAPVVKTPFLNQLAREGIRFTHNMVTTSICWVSRATLFTGQYASRHKSTRLKTPKFYDTWYNLSWPALLQQKAGYYVGHVGKWQYRNSNRTVESFFNYSSLVEGYHWFGSTSASDRARDDTLKFLRSEQRPKDQPFALTVAFYPPKAVGESPEPGAQWKPKPETRQQFYNNETIPLPPYNLSESYQKLPWFFHAPPDNVKEEGRKRWNQRFNSTEQYQEAMKNYYSLITEVDIACREIVDELKVQGILDETLIIFTTDNGLFHAEHGLAGKWYPYQESIRVPLIIRDPRMPEDKRNALNDALTLNIDLAPTILGAAGIKAPSKMQGRDIADLYLGKAKDNNPWRTEFLYEFPLNNGNTMPMSSALVRHDIKFIYWFQYNYEELFNLTEDPLEQHDVSKDPRYVHLLPDLRERLAQMQMSVH